MKGEAQMHPGRSSSGLSIAVRGTLEKSRHMILFSFFMRYG